MSFTPFRRNPVRSPHVVAFARMLLCGFFCSGCANPGPPRPPSLHLPALVTDLTAERIGDRVHLQWTTPSVTTDGLPMKGAMTAQICREAGFRTAASTPTGPACAPILSLAVSPGPSDVSDVLQGALRSDPVSLLIYRVQLSNSADRSAGNSTAAALAAAGSAPRPVEDLKATASENGAVLAWDAIPGKQDGAVELLRVDLSVQPAAAKASKPAASNTVAKPGQRKKPGSAREVQEHPEQVRLRAPETAYEENKTVAGTVDASAKTGDTYTYTAQRVRPVSIGGHTLEIRSEPSGPVTLAVQDIFPPAPPASLATIAAFTPATAQGSGQRPVAATAYIDLSWEPNSEPDLAGYFVYRQRANADGSPQGAMARLTSAAISGPAYRDVAVIPGQRYIYQVTAVDASGNESAPSAKAQDAVTPESNSPN